jgi:hypothetical protein
VCWHQVYRCILEATIASLGVHGTMGCSQISFKLVWWSHQLLSGILTKDHLPWVSCQSCRSLMLRVIMKWSRGLCTDLLAFVLQLRKSLKTSARRLSDEWAVRQVIASNGFPFLQMWSVEGGESSSRALVP